MEKRWFVFFIIGFFLITIIPAEDLDVTIEVVILGPTLVLISPENITYNSNNNLLLNFTVTNEDAIWYNLDNTANITVTGETLFSTTWGSHILFLFANNSDATISRNVTFALIEPADPPVDPGNGGGSCFTAGTKILMADGTSKNIEDVKVGDEIESYDLINNEITFAKVLELESPLREGFYSINNKVNVTNEHPFYVLRKNNEYAWAAVIEEAAEKDIGSNELNGLEIYGLEIGDKFFTSNSEWEEVETIEYYEGEVQTYNLKSVDNYHVFFANDFLVHNKGGDGPSCQVTWSCTEWINVKDQCGIRFCRDVNSCGTNALRPQEILECPSQAVAPYCGDGNCTAGETFETCSNDCTIEGESTGNKLGGLFFYIILMILIIAIIITIVLIKREADKKKKPEKTTIILKKKKKKSLIGLKNNKTSKK